MRPTGARSRQRAVLSPIARSDRRAVGQRPRTSSTLCVTCRRASTSVAADEPSASSPDRSAVRDPPFSTASSTRSARAGCEDNKATAARAPSRARRGLGGAAEGHAMATMGAFGGVAMGATGDPAGRAMGDHIVNTRGGIVGLAPERQRRGEKMQRMKAGCRVRTSSPRSWGRAIFLLAPPPAHEDEVDSSRSHPLTLSSPRSRLWRARPPGRRARPSTSHRRCRRCAAPSRRPHPPPWTATHGGSIP